MWEQARIRLLVATSCVVALAAALAGAADAHFDSSSRYTYGACPATQENRIDPINVVFSVWGTWGRAVSQIESHAGWADTTGSTQYFADHGGCYAMHA